MIVNLWVNISEDWITLSLRSWIWTGPIEAMDSKPQQCLQTVPDDDDDDDGVNLRRVWGWHVRRVAMTPGINNAPGLGREASAGWYREINYTQKSGDWEGITAEVSCLHHLPMDYKMVSPSERIWTTRCLFLVKTVALIWWLFQRGVVEHTHIPVHTWILTALV